MADYSFHRDCRLLRRIEFVRLGQRGRKFHNRYFLVIATPSTSGRWRLGVTVTRKVGRAVVRNRIKRQTREFFRHRRRNGGDPWDVNVIAKKQAAGQASGKINDALAALFDRLERCQESNPNAGERRPRPLQNG